MTFEGTRFYPGEDASPRQLLALADSYRSASGVLAGAARRGDGPSRAPYRLLAVHAVELYLNALVLATGRSHAEARGFGHDLGSRAGLADLGLRKRTAAHLHGITEAREYLSARYDPACAGFSELNRLAATLAEVAAKVTSAINRLEAGLAPDGQAALMPARRASSA